MKTNNKFWLTISFVSVWAFATSAAAQASNFPQEGPMSYRTVRNLGMGNAGIAAKGSHQSSPHYNPAGLNDLEDGKFEFLSPKFEASTNAISIIKDTADFASDLDDATTDSERLDIFDQFIQDQAGDALYTGFALNVFNYAKKNFAAGLLINERFRTSFRNLAYPNFQFQNLGDVGLYVSGAYDFFEKNIQVGVTLRPTVRFALDEIDEEISTADILTKNADGDPIVLDQFKNIKDRHFGLGVDLGLKSQLTVLKDILPIYDMLQPAVAFTWQDIGSPSFGSAPGNEQSMSLGMAIHPALWKLENVFALDVRDINQEKPFLSKLHIGVETKFPWILALRAGLSQGYFTAGATFDLWVVKLEGAFYQEEVGKSTREDGDKRFAVGLSFGI